MNLTGDVTEGSQTQKTDHVLSVYLKLRTRQNHSVLSDRSQAPEKPRGERGADREGVWGTF